MTFLWAPDPESSGGIKINIQVYFFKNLTFLNSILAPIPSTREGDHPPQHKSYLSYEIRSLPSTRDRDRIEFNQFLKVYQANYKIDKIGL